MTSFSLDDDLRTEADRILDSGLRALLEEHGEVHVVGSYALRLMTWRDLDIHIVQDAADRPSFFRLGGRIADVLRPHRMHFRDESLVATPGLPRGFYWGVYLGDERRGAWKIDIWQTSAVEFEPVRRFGDSLSERLDATTREAVLAIKGACWTHPEYRRGFTSADVYSAVLDRGVRNLAGFWRDLEQTKGIRKGGDLR